MADAVNLPNQPDDHRTAGVVLLVCILAATFQTNKLFSVTGMLVLICSMLKDPHA